MSENPEESTEKDREDARKYADKKYGLGKND